jgi:hypothetical protein
MYSALKDFLDKLEAEGIFEWEDWGCTREHLESTILGHLTGVF